MYDITVVFHIPDVEYPEGTWEESRYNVEDVEAAIREAFEVAPRQDAVVDSISIERS